jgi:uncharacterized protein (DUF1330 family)
MKVYVLAHIRVLNPDRIKTYSQMTTPIVESFGGRYLARGGKVDVLEGSYSHTRTVIIEFPDAAAAHAWWNSNEYKDAKNLRQQIAETDLILVEGILAPFS